MSGALPIMALTSSIAFGVSLAWVVMLRRGAWPRGCGRIPWPPGPICIGVQTPWARHRRGRSSGRAPCVDSSLRSLGRLLIG